MCQLLLPALLALVFPTASAEDSWPQFRGPGGDGQAGAASLPLQWSETRNLRWKTPIHDRGHSSPVLWARQIWLTTATRDGHRLFVLCLDRDSGKILHDVKLFDVEKPEPIQDLNSYASPTPVIEAGRVYVHFGTYGTACLDTQTAQPLWVRRDLHCDHFRGPGASAFVWGDLLILHFDGIDVQYLVALDKKTGSTVWKTNRSTDFGKLDGDLRKAYCTPLVVEADGRPLLISPGAQAAMAYDPRTGEEIWKLRYPGGYSNTSRPIAGHGLVFLNSGFGRTELLAVRPDGRGDVTDSHIAWRFKKGVPTKPSPVLVGDLIFMVHDSGMASCIEARTGKPVWQEKIGGRYSASPVAAAGRVYFFDHDGRTTVLEAGRTMNKLSVNELDAGCMASPAVGGRALFLRTATHLYRIQQP